MTLFYNKLEQRDSNDRFLTGADVYLTIFN